MSLTTSNKRNSHSRTKISKNQNGLVDAEGCEGAWVANGPLLSHDSSRTVDVTAAAHQLTAAEFVGGYVIISAGANNVILPPASEIFEYIAPGMASMPTAIIGASPALYPSFKFVLRNDTAGDVNLVDSLVGAKDAAASTSGAIAVAGGTNVFFHCYVERHSVGVAAANSIIVLPVGTAPVTGGGGAPGSLSATLAVGNTTGANDIVVDNGQQLVFGTNGVFIDSTTPANDVAIGFNVTLVTPGTASIGIGSNTTVASASVAIGNNADAANLQSTAIGAEADVTGNASVGVGYDANCGAGNSVAIGGSTTVNGASSVVVGHGSTALGDASVVIGAASLNNDALHDNCIVIGANSTTTAAGEFRLASVGNPINTQTTVGAAGVGPDPLPATPTVYLNVFVNGTEYVLPLFAPS